MLHKPLFLLFLILLVSSTQAQTTYTWNGSTSNSWNVTTNWTPNGVPSATDNVVIVTGANPCTISANTVINNLVLTSGTLNTVTFSFTVNGDATLTAGNVSGTAGTLDCEGTTAIFGNTTTGPLINAVVIINTLTVKLQRTVFNNNITITKLAAGSSIDSWRGGNTFNGSFYLNNASAFTTDNIGDIYIGSNANDPPDIFNGRSTFYITGCARIRIPQNGTAVFNGVASFYSNGYGTVHDRMQPARSGTATVTFNDSTYFYCNSTTTDVQIAYDAGTKATFNGPVVATHYGPSAAAFLFGNDGTVKFNNNVYLNCLGTGAVAITEGVGNSTLANGKTISIGSLGFVSGRLEIDNFTQLGTTPQSLTLTGTAALSIGAAGKPSVYNANVNFSAPRVILLASTFNGTSVFTKTGGTADDSGGNTFNNTVTLNNSGTSEFRFSSSIAADAFTNSLDINNTGSGSIRLSRSYNTSYSDNITVNNTVGGGIYFGANGGSSVLANGKTITVGAGGYANGYLYLYRFSQASATAQTLNLSGTGTILRMGDQANITSGCSFPSNFTASAKGIELTGNTFGGTTTFNQSGPTTTRTWGGNTFTGAHTINVSDAAGIQCSQLFAAETYYSAVNVNLTSSGGVTLSRSFNTVFPENITLTSTSTGAAGFGFNGGASTLVNGKTVSIGGAGYTGTTLFMYKFNQVGPTPQALVLTGISSEIQLGSAATSTYGCTFGGNLSISAPNYIITGNTFSGTTTFIKTGGDDDDDNGNNTFIGAHSFANTGATPGVIVRMSNLFGGDIYNGVTTFSTSCPTGGFVLARIYNAAFNDHIICNSTGGYIYFGAGTSLNGTATLAANKTITCGTFSSGLLCFRRFYQLGNTPQIINTTGTANIEYGGNSTNTNTFSNFEGSLTTASTNYIAITNSVFKDNATFTAKYYLNFINSSFNTLSGNTSLLRSGGTTSDDLGGGNTINGNFLFGNTGSGRFRSGVTAYGGDIFNGNVNVNNSGSGTISFAYNNGANPIAGNLNLLSSFTGSIIFGEAATSNAITIGGNISANTGNYTNGTITLRYLTQNAGTNTISGTSEAVAFTLARAIINGALNIDNTGSTSVLNSTLNSSVTTINSGSTTFNTSVFNNITSTTNSGVSTLVASTFNGDVTTVNTSTTSVRTCTLNAVNNFTSSAFILGGTSAQGNIFNVGSSIFTKTGTSNDDVNGGNIFNTTSTFNITNAAGRWRLADPGADDFNDNATFNQQNAGILAPAYDANCTFAGNITVSAPAGSAITFAAGTGRVTMDGSSAQSISKTAGNDPNFDKFTLAKSSNDVTLNTRINIITNFTPTSGLLNTSSANILNMNNSSATTIGNAASYVNGPMNYDMATNSSSRRTLNFPIGKIADWRPAVLQVSHNANTSYTYKAELTNASANALGWTLPVTVDLVSLTHYWDIDRYVTATSVPSPTTELRTTIGTNGPVITLYYDTNDGVTDPAKLTVCKNTYTAGTAWIDIGGTGATLTTGSISSTSSPTSFNSFSRFTLGNRIGGTNPLPIELLYFDALLADKQVSLDWATASELNNSRFDIEKSADGVNFEYMTTVNAHGTGTSTIKQVYNTRDKDPYKGISYYRLKQIDKTGDFKYAGIVSVEFTEKSFINLYPNPTTGILNIKATEDYTNAYFKVINALGIEVVPNSLIRSHDETIDLSGLAAGIYYVVIDNGNKTENVKISVHK